MNSLFDCVKVATNKQSVAWSGEQCTQGGGLYRIVFFSRARLQLIRNDFLLIVDIIVIVIVIVFVAFFFLVSFF